MGNLNLRVITGPPIPSAPKGCKAPTVDDIIALADFIKGRDPAWRHVTAHQHYTLTQKFSPNFRPETLECAKSDSTKHREEIKRNLSFLFDNAPAFPDEVHLMRTARERFKRFQRGAVKEFADLPFELRYTLNLFNRAARGPLNDFSVPEQFTSSTRKGLDWAIREGVLSQGTDGKIILSEQAKLRLINTVKRDPFPPVVSAHLLTVLRSVNQAVTGKRSSSLELKQLMPRYAEEQALLLADSYRSIPTSSPLASLKAAPAVSAQVAHRLRFIKDALDSLERKKKRQF